MPARWNATCPDETKEVLASELVYVELARRTALLLPAAAPVKELGLAPEREVALKNGALDVRLLLLGTR